MHPKEGLPSEDDLGSKSAVVRMETEIAQASLDNVSLRDPKATDHKMSFADLQKLTPNFNWTTYYQRAGLRTEDLNVTEPRFLVEFNRQLASTSIADWKTTSSGTCSTLPHRRCPTRLCKRTLPSKMPI